MRIHGANVEADAVILDRDHDVAAGRPIPVRSAIR